MMSQLCTLYHSIPSCGMQWINPLKKSAVVMKNCSIQQSRRTLTFEIIANKRTKVDSSLQKFQVEGGVDRHATIKVLSISEACRLSPGSLVFIMVKIKTVTPPEELLQQSHVMKQDCTVADATGSCRLVLWAGHVGAVTEGLSYHLKTVAVRQCKNQKYMSTLEHTTDFEKINDIGPINDPCVTTETKIVGEISRVLLFERNLSCPECNSKVQKIDSICGECTKCSGTVKLSKCCGNINAKVKLEDEGKLHLATMFTNVILAIIQNNEGNVSPELVFTIDNRDIVTHVTKEPSSQDHNMQEPADVNAVAVAIATGIDTIWREDPIVEL